MRRYASKNWKEYNSDLMMNNISCWASIKPLFNCAVGRTQL